MSNEEIVQAIARQQALAQTGQSAFWYLYVANIENHLRWIEAAGFQLVAQSIADTQR